VLLLMVAVVTHLLGLPAFLFSQTDFYHGKTVTVIAKTPRR
jgi:3-deoxy-D-manno-octulosonic acid (KDO) 8-phosphate synthase